jgi:hypothetical protein
MIHHRGAIRMQTKVFLTNLSSVEFFASKFFQDARGPWRNYIRRGQCGYRLERVSLQNSSPLKMFPVDEATAILPSGQLFSA